MRLAEAAYAVGARYVDVWYWEPHAKRSRLQHAPLDSLSQTPAWLDERARAAVDGGAYIRVDGDPNPTLLSDADPARATLDSMPVNQVIRQGQREGTLLLEHLLLPDRGLGQRHPRRAQPRPALGRGRHVHARSTSRTRCAAWDAHIDRLEQPQRRAHASAGSTRSASAAPAPT